MEHFFATSPRGLERVLTEELAALGAREAVPVDGGAAFGGNLELCYAVNLESRVASRVLWQVGRARYRSEHDIFEAIEKILCLEPKRCEFISHAYAMVVTGKKKKA
jgi:putative N6-adenine-specific DNA methylase